MAKEGMHAGAKKEEKLLGECSFTTNTNRNLGKESWTGR